MRKRLFAGASPSILAAINLDKRRLGRKTTTRRRNAGEMHGRCCILWQGQASCAIAASRPASTLDAVAAGPRGLGGPHFNADARGQPGRRRRRRRLAPRPASASQQRNNRSRLIAEAPLGKRQPDGGAIIHAITAPSNLAGASPRIPSMPKLCPAPAPAMLSRCRRLLACCERAETGSLAPADSISLRRPGAVSLVGY